MALFGLFKRKKREELSPQPSLPEAFKQYPQEGYGTEAFSQPMPAANQNLNPLAFQQGTQSNYMRDIDLILSKLDIIKSNLDNISRRLEALEKSIYGTQSPSYEQARKTW